MSWPITEDTIIGSSVRGWGPMLLCIVTSIEETARSVPWMHIDPVESSSSGRRAVPCTVQMLPQIGNSLAVLLSPALHLKR